MSSHGQAPVRPNLRDLGESGTHSLLSKKSKNSCPSIHLWPLQNRDWSTHSISSQNYHEEQESSLIRHENPWSARTGRWPSQRHKAQMTYERQRVPLGRLDTSSHGRAHPSLSMRTPQFDITELSFDYTQATTDSSRLETTPNFHPIVLLG